MEKTKTSPLIFTTILAVVATAYAGLVAQGDVMIEYVCVDKNPFLWIFHLYLYLSCGWYVALGTIFVSTLVIWVVVELARWLYNIGRGFIYSKSTVLKMVAVNNISQHFFHEPFIESISGIGIIVENNREHEITNCFGTLESLQRICIVNNKLVVDDRCVVVFLDPLRKLRWVVKDYDDILCEKSIVGKSKENVLLVANFTRLVKIVTKRKKTTINSIDKLYFNFAFCKADPSDGQLQGLFKAKVRINGKIASNDVPEIVEYFEGYLYSYMEQTSPSSTTFDIYWSSNPLRDQKIRSDPWVVKELSDGR